MNLRKYVMLHRRMPGFLCADCAENIWHPYKTKYTPSHTLTATRPKQSAQKTSQQIFSTPLHWIQKRRIKTHTVTVTCDYVIQRTSAPTVDYIKRK